MTTVLALAVLLGGVIFVHELGHFLAAKIVGVGVPRFSIGFGQPTPLRFTWGETEYVLSWIPLGGYVKLATREEDVAGTSAIEGGVAPDFPAERLFENKSLLGRIFILSAGVVMNVVLAWALYAGIAASGTLLEDPVTRLAEADTTMLPAAAESLARVPFGADITRINGDTVRSWNDVRDAILDPGSDRLRFDFAGGIDPVIVNIPGTAAEQRVRVYTALHNLHLARVGEVEAGSPAARAGIEPGDEIVRIDGDTVRYWDEMVTLVRPRPDAPLTVTLVRNGNPITVRLTTEAVDDKNPATGETERVGKLGVYLEEQFQRVTFTPWGAVVEGASETADNVRLVLVTLRGLVLGKVSPKELGGPIIIGQMSGRAARMGVIPFLSFMAFISINLAIFNLLPIPVLDGGHLVFLLAEGVRGRPVPAQLRLRLTQLGMAVLLMIVVLVMYNDVLRVFGLR
jgi:regulator of sigma E protease